MRLRFLAIVFGCFSTLALTALHKVAVLDAVLSSSIEESVNIGITEKISEQLVASGKFMVLDRTTVGQSLKEIEFQMSGLVSDVEIRNAGEQLSSRLGASHVVVARVSFISGTYFITAKMIDVKTGEIAAQASDQAEGKASITLMIAERVGKKLAEDASGGGVAEDTIGPELLLNPSFDYRIHPWVLYVHAPASANCDRTTIPGEFDSAPAGCKIVCYKQGRVNPFDMEFCIGTWSIKKNTWYRLAFQAKATVEFKIMWVSLMKWDAPYSDYCSEYSNRSPSITTAWQRYEVLFYTHTIASDASIRLYLTLPTSAIFYIDSLSLKELR